MIQAKGYVYSENLQAWADRLSADKQRTYEIIYHPQSGWFEDTPLKGGTEEGYPLKGVHEGTCLLEAEQHAGTTLALLGSHHGSVYSLSVAPRVALGVWV